MQRRHRVGLGCVVAGAIGWAVIVVIAVGFPGGHPPLVAYVAVPVILGLLPVNLIGLWASLPGAAQSQPRGSRRLPISLAVANAALVLVGLTALLANL